MHCFLSLFMNVLYLPPPPLPTLLVPLTPPSPLPQSPSSFLPFYLQFLSSFLLSVIYFSATVCSLFASLSSLLVCFSHLCSVLHWPPVMLPSYFRSCKKPQFLPLFLYSVSILLPEEELSSKLGDHINCRN